MRIYPIIKLLKSNTVYIIIVIFIIHIVLQNNYYKEFQTKQQDVGFIVTRCVKKPHHNTLFKECYQAIRKYHPDLKIIFIDDNSDKNILDDDYKMDNVEIISSEYPAAGEYLPYWYLLQRKMFKKAIFLQDSMILNKRIPYEKVNDYMFLYEFDVSTDYIELFDILANTKIPKQLKSLKDSGYWMGCWGSTMVITSSFIDKLENVIGISKWKDQINNRRMRIAFESAIGLSCMYINNNRYKYSLFGNVSDMNIMKDPGNEKYTLEMYLADKSRIKDSIIKIWNGR